MVAPSGKAAVANARRQSTCAAGMCLKNVRTWWGVNAMYPDAIGAWNGAKRKHPGDKTPPLGAPVFWRGGKHGHVAIYTGGELIRSTDCRRTGQVSDAHGSWVRNTWGYTYLGWTGDLNGVNLPLAVPPPPPPPPSPDKDDDMPRYVSLGGPGFTCKASGEWEWVRFSKEYADAGKVHPDNSNSPSLLLGSAFYQGYVALNGIKCSDPDAVLSVRWIELEGGEDVKSRSTPDDHPVPPGVGGILSSYTDVCAARRKIRAQARAIAKADIVIGSAGIKMNYWPR